jgi:GIY-YIG catalytic domain-containing protein
MKIHQSFFKNNQIFQCRWNQTRPIVEIHGYYTKKYAAICIFKKSLKNWSLIRQTKQINNSSPYRLAINTIKNNLPVTAAIINDILALTDEVSISISQDHLEELLKIPRLEFANLNKETTKSKKFIESIGTVRDEKCVAGVYIWTHLLSGNKYVGSSSTLARRLIGYFKGTHAEVGKFIPFLIKEGLNAFKLQVIPITSKNSYTESYELCLEQYFLLDPKFNLNTLRVVNKISGSRSKPVFIYNIDYTQLLYTAYNQEEIIFGLNVHYSTIINCKLTGEAYLGKYHFTEVPKLGSKEQLLSITELLTLFEKDRLANLEKVGRKINIKSEDGKTNLKFNSINDCLVFLNTKAPSYKTTLRSAV